MKRLLIAAFALCSTSAWAQQLELPRPSPFAKTVQTTGLTEITIDYSSPGVKGRKIWGEVVPFGQVWRTGANTATKVTFGKDVTIGTSAVPAGSYAFFAIPNAESWTLIVNKDFNQGGSSKYNKELDVVRLEVKPEAIPMRERLAYTVTDFNDDQANISLEWEKVRVSLPVKLGTAAQMEAAIKDSDENAWASANGVSRYYLGKKNFDAALSWADKSIHVKETWQNDWSKAQGLAGKGKSKDALSLAQKAQQLGAKDGKDFYAKDEIAKSVAEWKTKK